MDLEDIKALTVSQDPIERAFGLYMQGDKNNKEIAIALNLNYNTLKNYVRAGHSTIGDGKAWKKLRQELQHSRAKEMIKVVLPSVARSVARGAEGLEEAIDQITENLKNKVYEKEDVPNVATKLVGILDRLVKIKRLEVGEATQNIDIHSSRIQDMSTEDAQDIIDEDFIQELDV